MLHNMLSATIAPREMSAFQVLAIARRPNVIPEGRLRADRSLLISPEVTSWGEARDRFAPSGVVRWWPRPPRPTAFLTDPTNARAFGRLLLFQDYQDQGNVPKKVQQCIEETIRQSARPGSDGRRLVLILASIAEGEGSGMLLDIAALVHSYLMSYPATVVAVLSVAANTADENSRTLAMATAYATLKELDALMVNPGQIEIGIPPGARRASEQRPLFDYVLIGGDGEDAQSQNPSGAALTAEMAYTWLRAHASTEAPGVPLPPHRSHTGRRDRFDGYTFFNVSKLGLPVAAANELIGGQIAQRLLDGLVSMRTQIAVGPWVQSVMQICHQDMLVADVLRKPGVRERVNEMQRFASSAMLMPDIERRKDRPDFSLRQISDEFLTFLHNETKSSNPARDDDTEATAPGRLDTLRARVEDTLDRAERGLEEQLAALPTQLACAEGYSLPWVSDAFFELVRETNLWRNKFGDQANEAVRAYQEARKNVDRAAKEVDDRVSGGLRRLLRTLSARDLADWLRAIELATEATMEYVRSSTVHSFWKRLTAYVDELSNRIRLTFKQIDTLKQSNEALIARTIQSLEQAAKDGARFPMGALADGDWYRQGAATAGGALEMPHAQLLERIFKSWAVGKSSVEQQLDRFLRDLPGTCARYVAGGVQFAPLQLFLTQHASRPAVQQALADFPGSANPAWMPDNHEGGWSAHEWLRRGATRLRSLMLPPTQNWQRVEMPSPDQDEMCLIRMVHGVSAAQIEQLKVRYRRAYERTVAETVPMHIDKHIESTLPDLMPSSRQAEISTLWEFAIQAAGFDPMAIREILKKLGEALEVDSQQIEYVQIRDTDYVLSIFTLDMKAQLPPPRCPVVFSYSRRSAGQLGQSLSNALDALGLVTKFVFLINANNRPDLDDTLRVLHVGAYNVVIVNEAEFKAMVGAPSARRMLMDKVLKEVDLKLISPFQPAAPVPDRMFFGREKEITQVHFKIRDHSVTLIGGRRIGKTSMLQRIKRELEKESTYQPIYLDCHNLMTYEHFFHAIRLRWGMSEFTGSEPMLFEEIVFDLKRRYPKRHLIFLLDEVDRLLRYDIRQRRNREQLFRTFRALSNEKYCQFIFSGERFLVRTVEDSHAAFFNFAYGIYLKCLDQDTVKQLVTEPFREMNLELENEQRFILRIMELSAGHPRVVQTICQSIISTLEKEEINQGLLKEEHLNRALKEPELRTTIIHTFWGQSQPLARLITLLWDVDQPTVTKESLYQHLRRHGLQISSDELNAAVRELELYQVVPEDGPTLELMPVELPRLIRETFKTELKNEIASMVKKVQARQLKQQRRT